MRLRDNVILRFVVLFALLMVSFQLVYYEFVVSSAPFRTYLEASARAAAVLLGLFGENVTVSGTKLRSDFSVAVKYGCDGLQAMWILVAGVALFPGSLLRKLAGVLTGIGLLLILNIVRIASLAWAGEHAPSWFQPMHVHIWPAALVFCAMIFWVLWAQWATRLHKAA